MGLSKSIWSGRGKGGTEKQSAAFFYDMRRSITHGCFPFAHAKRKAIPAHLTREKAVFPTKLEGFMKRM